MADISISRLLTATIKSRTAVKAFSDTFVSMSWVTTSSLEDIFDISMPTLTASLKFLLTDKAFFETLVADDEIEVTSNVSGGLTLYLTIVSCNIVYSKGEVDIQCSAGWLTESPKFKGIVQLLEEDWSDVQAKYGIEDIEYHRKAPAVQIAVESKGDFALGVANASPRPSALSLTPFTISNDVRDWYPIPGYNPFAAGWYQHKGLAIIPTFDSALQKKFSGIIGYSVSPDDIADYRFSSAHEPVTHVITRSAGKLGPAPLIDLANKSSARIWHIPQRGLSAMYVSEAGVGQELHWTDGVVTQLSADVSPVVYVVAITPDYYISLDTSANVLEAHSRYDSSVSYQIKTLTASESSAIRLKIQASDLMFVVDELLMPEEHFSNSNAVLASYHLWFNEGAQVGNYPNEQFLLGIHFQIVDNYSAPVVVESMEYITHVERVAIDAGNTNVQQPYYLGSTVVRTDDAYVSTKGSYTVQALFATATAVSTTYKYVGVCYCNSYAEGYDVDIQAYDIFTQITSLPALSSLTQFGVQFYDSCASCQVPTTYESTMITGSILFNSSYYYFVVGVGDSGLFVEQLSPSISALANQPFVYFVDVPVQPTERQSVLASIMVFDRTPNLTWSMWRILSHSGVTSSGVSWYAKYVDILGSGLIQGWDPELRLVSYRRNLLFNTSQTPAVYRAQLGGSPFTSRTIGDSVFVSKLRSGRQAEVQMPFKVGMAPTLPADLASVLGKIEIDITGFSTGSFDANLSALHIIPLGALVSIQFPTERWWTYVFKVTSYSLNYDGVVSATVSGIVVKRVYNPPLG